jgi:hypothetical protein
MNVAELMARAAKRLTDADPKLLGVRICPISLTPGDAELLRTEVQARLGKKTYIAISIPGVKPTLSDRVCVAPDGSAAQHANDWRNSVEEDPGTHLFYASVQKHGKAGSLTDCLSPVNERHLRDEFAEWCDEKGSGMPTGLGAALRGSGILSRASAVALCEFSSAVLRDKRENRWEACGSHLPLLNLARDDGLRPSNAAARFEENERVVSRAATGERVAGVTSGPTAQLREAFRAAADDVPARLKRIDLTEHIDVSLSKRKAPKREKKAVRQQKNVKPTKGRRPAKAELDPNVALVDAVQGAPEDPLTELERRAKKLGRAAYADAPPGSQETFNGDGFPADPVWSRDQQSKEFGALAERVPVGLAAMLLRSLRGDGFGLVWAARDSALALFTELPTQAEASEVRPEMTDPALRDMAQRVVELRRAAADLLLADADRGLRSLSTFIGAPLVALADRAVRGAMTALLEASAAFHAAAAKSADGPGRAAALAFDTVAVRARSGDMVLVVGPLHPLWLSQALGRFETLLTQTDLNATAKRLLVRSLSEAPAAPEFWPAGAGAPLQLSRPLGGLIAYQSTAEELEPGEVEDSTARVVRLLIESQPHARFGLRVAVSGGDSGPVIDGVARALEDHPELERAAVYHRGPGQAAGSERTERAIVSKRLTFGALPAAGDRFDKDLKPHVVFHLAPPSTPGMSLQPSTPTQPGLGASSGLLPTEFTVVESGLRARTPIDGARFPALAAFEALHALASGGQPQAAFERNAWAVSLRALLAEGTGPGVSWDVILAPRIGRRPPEHRFLLSHERVSERLSVAIVSREIAPAARALREAFKALGIEDLRPLVLNNLAIHLASLTSQGILSTQRSGDQVLAASVLGMALRREFSGKEAFVAYLDGGGATTLLGQVPSTLPGAFALGFGADADQLRVVLGYAALGEAVDADVTRGQLSGGLQEVFSRLASTVELASTVDGVGAVAAREALNWLLWPAVAAAEQPASRTERLLLQLDRGVQCTMSAVAYLPPGSAVLKRPPGAKLGKIPIVLRALDVASFEALVFGGEKTR